MRELHGYHGEHRRHAHDATAPADTHGKHARDRAHETPKHASHDSPKFKILWDPAARKAEHLKYQQKVEAAEAEYAAKHAKPKPGDQPRSPEQVRPNETAAERKDVQNEAKAALAEVDNRTLPKPAQVEDVAAKQKSRVSDKGISYLAMVGSYIVNTAAEYVSAIPPHLANDVSGGLLVLAAGLVLRREKHRKDGNADRSQD